VPIVMDNYDYLYLDPLDKFLGAKNGNYPRHGDKFQGSNLEWSA
jgi:hypothetical protein